MIDERHMTAEGMRSALEMQQRCVKLPSLFEGLTALCDGAAQSAAKRRRHYNGTIGILAVSRLRNIVGTMRANGFNIDLWLGSGWLSKPYTITAYPDDMKIVELNLAQK